MPEETRPVQTSDRVTSPGRGFDGAAGIANPQFNGQDTFHSAPPADVHHKTKAWIARLALSFVVFAVLALLGTGVMLLLHYEWQTAFKASVLGAFLLAVGLYQFMPASWGHAGNAAHAAPNDFVMLVRWLAGLLLVMCSGWALFGISAYLFRHDTQNMQMALGFSSILSL